MFEPNKAASTFKMLTNAALGPSILNSLPPKSAAMIPPQNPVIIPATGLDPLAMGRDIH